MSDGVSKSVPNGASRAFCGSTKTKQASLEMRSVLELRTVLHVRTAQVVYVRTFLVGFQIRSSFGERLMMQFPGRVSNPYSLDLCTCQIETIRHTAILNLAQRQN